MRFSAPKRTGSPPATRSRPRPRDRRARAVLAQGRANSARSPRRRTRQSDIRSCSSTSSLKTGSESARRRRRTCPALWHSTRGCGAEPCSRPSVTPDWGCTSEPCSSTSSSSPPRRYPSTTSCSAAPARKSRPPRRPRCPSPRSRCPFAPWARTRPRCPVVALPRGSSATVILPIAQSEPTVRTMRAGTSRFSPVGTLRPGGGRRRSRSSAPRAAARARRTPDRP